MAGRLNIASWSIPTRLTAIVLALAIPLNIVLVAVVWHLAGAAGETQRAALMYTARSIAAALDAELGRYRALAEALARSPALLEGNMSAFEAEARRVLEPGDQAWIIVTGVDGKQWLNTAASKGTPLPPRSPNGIEAQKQAFAERAAIVSDVVYGPIARGWVAAVDAPVFSEGRPYLTVAVSIRVDAFLALLNAHNMPKNWIAGIIDSRGRFITRVPGHDTTVGLLASEGWRAIKDREGVSDVLSRDGVRVVNANVHSRLSPWTVGIGVPKSQLQDSAWSAIRWALLLGGALSAASFILAASMARSIARPITELREKAPLLLANPGAAPASGPPEIADLWSALQRAALERNRAERDLRSSEARYRQLADSMPQLVWTARADGKLDYWNSRISSYDGAWRDENGQWHWDGMIDDDDVASTNEAWSRASASGTDYEHAHRLRTANGEIRWHLSRASPVRDESGHILRWFGTATDIHDLRTAEEQLRRSYGTYLNLIQNAPFGVYLVDSGFRLAQVSKGAHDVFKNVSPLIGRDFGEILRAIWVEPFASAAIARFRHTLETGEPYHTSDMTEQRRDIDLVQSYDWQIERVSLPDGSNGVVCYFYDLTGQRQQEQHIRFLMNELNHRAKNLLGVVQAIARLTAATNPKDFMTRFGERVQALSANQDLLVRNEWRGVSVRDLVCAQVAFYADLVGTRICIEGPDLLISAAGAQAIGMALHELATNAGKHGALSTEKGRVDVHWQLASETFTISWNERDGPPVSAPSSTGFGTTVIENMAAMGVSGTVELNYPPTGLTWTLSCKAKNVLAYTPS